MPPSSKYTLSLPAVVTIYTFQFPTVNLAQAHAEIPPLPSQRELAVAFQRRQSRSVVSTLLINTRSSHLTATDTSSQSSREIRREINHLEFTLQVITQPCLGLEPTEPRASFHFQGMAAEHVCTACQGPHTCSFTLGFLPHSDQDQLLNSSCSKSFFCTKSYSSPVFEDFSPPFTAASFFLADQNSSDSKDIIPTPSSSTSQSLLTPTRC